MLEITDKIVIAIVTLIVVFVIAASVSSCIQNVSVLVSPRSIGPFVNDYKFDEELTHEFWNRYRLERDIIDEREIRRKVYEEDRLRIGVDEAKGCDYTAYSELLKLCPSIQELLHD